MSTIQEIFKQLPKKSEQLECWNFLTQRERDEIEALLNSFELEDDRDDLLKQTEGETLLEWLANNFPTYVRKPFAQRHLKLWRWIEALTPGVAPAARAEIWPRGGAKSTTGELGVARVGFKLSRKYGLYVSGTQEQADKHVVAVAGLFERLGMDRALNKYGSSKGWRRNQLRVANGFSLEGIGLDTASRGAKIDEDRPGFIIFDDIDSQHDSPRTVEKKEETIKSAIIPAGSADCAILFLQNLIHEGSVVSRLYNGQADYLLDREIPEISVAIEGLKVESVDRGDGRKIWKIVEGVPTWEGQDLTVCEKQINDYGLRTFLREAQQEVQQADGYFFDHTKFEIVDEIPEGFKYRLARSWDFAATQGGGDYTAGPLVGIARNGTWLVFDLEHDQLSSEKVRDLVKGTAHRDRNVFGDHIITIPQDPGQAGVSQADQFVELLDGFNVELVRPDKAKSIRARGWADAVNSGNVYLLRAEWNHKFIQQHRKFREDGDHEYDDIIDGCSDAYNTLAAPSKEISFSW